MRFQSYHRLFLFALACAGAAEGQYSFESAQGFLRTYCLNCHQGKSAAGGFRLEQVNAPASLRDAARKWTSLNRRVRDREMPPKGAPAPPIDQIEQFTDWVGGSLRAEACSAGVTGGPSPIRRLNRDEYANTLRDLLDIHLDLASALPAEGAGGEGFDNAAETLFLSPLHSEKYMEIARFALDFAAKEYKSRTRILITAPGNGVTETEAARQIFAHFLPKAFRRPVKEDSIAPYLTLFHAARKQGQQFDASVFFALRAALVSPMFLFRAEPPNTGTESRPVDQYAMASRLSYFIWGSMPDELLFDVAEAGKLQDPEVLQQLVRRMLRSEKSMAFARGFVEQWLRTRELATDKAPDSKLIASFPDPEELRSDIRYQPVMFFRELVLRDLPLLHLLDSRYTIGTSNLAKLHGPANMPVRKTASKQPHWMELPEGTQLGGLLGMPAVLAVSSYPYRTSPVLRGAFILDSILGTPPLPPPPGVPPLEEHREGEAPKSVRERLTQHRVNPLCAGCHSRIDPMGFTLENFDMIGRWRDEDAGKPVDNSAELADGTKVAGPRELKAYLMSKKDLFVRNLAGKMLGYALGRGLTLQDSCAVDQIVEKVKENDYKAQSLIDAVVLSVPFRYQKEQAKP